MEHDKFSAPPLDTASRQASSGPLAVRLDRRKLLRGGASAAPVLLTLASTPVAAGNCMVASSFVSVATFKSRNPNTATVQCTTYNVEYWRTLSPRPPEMDSRVAHWLGSTGSTYNRKKLSEVIDQATNTSGELGVLQHIVALSLCCHKGYVTGTITKAHLAGIWVNYKSNGNRYELPASGISWDSGKLITWLRYLMYANPL